VLQEHGFGVPHEYLNTVHIPYLAQRWGLISREKKIDLARYLETCLSWRTNTQGIFSLKAHWSQFQPFLEKDLIAPYLQKARFIYIRRNDLLGQAISYEIASQTGKWGSKESASRRPVYDADAIERRMVNIAQQNMAWTLFFAKHRVEKVDVFYEEFIKDKEKCINDIGNKIAPEFKLELPERKPKPSELHIQRNVVNDDWRERFLAEKAI
jgi:LPS sulfotransferase NodH